MDPEEDENFGGLYQRSVAEGVKGVIWQVDPDFVFKLRLLFVLV